MSACYWHKPGARLKTAVSCLSEPYPSMSQKQTCLLASGLAASRHRVPCLDLLLHLVVYREHRPCDAPAATARSPARHLLCSSSSLR